jgi:hypothetical protein
MNTTKVIVATFKTKKAIQRELEFWTTHFPELNPSIFKTTQGYHIVRDPSSKDEGHFVTKIEVTA